MMLFAFTVSHASAPLSLLERLAFARDEIGDRLTRLLHHSGVGEAVILSTCHRVEVYAAISGSVPHPHLLAWFLADDRGVPRPVVEDGGRLLIGTDVARHLFAVSSGLDSMILGEHEVLGQIKAAFATGRAVGSVGPQLDGLFRWAITVGRRARGETALGRARRSVASLAVDLASKRLGGLHGRTIVVLGAGRVARGIVDRLPSKAVRLIVCSRTTAPAEDLVRSRGQAIPIEDLEFGLAQADILFSCATAALPLLHRRAVERALVGRDARPLLVVELSMPRAVDPAVGRIQGVEVIDLETMATVGRASTAALRAAATEVGKIVEDEVARFADWLAGRQASALITALRGRVEATCRRELERELGDRPSLSREAAHRALQRALAKLLHSPTVAARRAAATGDQQLLANLCRIFQLDESGGGSQAKDDAAAWLIPPGDGLHARCTESLEEAIEHGPIHVADWA